MTDIEHTDSENEEENQENDKQDEEDEESTQSAFQIKNTNLIKQAIKEFLQQKGQQASDGMVRYFYLIYLR